MHDYNHMYKNFLLISKTQLNLSRMPISIKWRIIIIIYTNIPYKEGIENALHFLTNDPDTYLHPEQPTPQVLAELMEIVLRFRCSAAF